MDGLQEHALLIETLAGTLSNTVFWDTKAKREFDAEKSLQGLITNLVTRDLRHLARTEPSRITWRPESREEWRDRHDFVHEALLNYESLAKPLYVEMRLSGNEERPIVLIVHAHETSFP